MVTTDLARALANPKAFDELDLSGVKYKKFPVEILSLTDLHELKLGYQCTFTEFPDAFAGLTKLRKLDLSGMKLETIPDAVTRLPALRDLSFYLCELRTIPESLANLVNLETLVLAAAEDASWGAAPMLFALPRLRELRVEGGLVGLTDAIARLPELESLELHGNQIERLPDAIAKLTKLRKLSLTNQSLTELPDGIGELTALEELTVSSSQLRTLPAAIGKLAKLKKLTLFGNPIEKLPPEIGDLGELTWLDLNATRLTELPSDIGKLAKLDVMWISDQLASLPDSFGDLASLETCHLETNKLTRLPETIGKLGKLKYFVLRENRLTSMPDSLAECGSLRIVELTGNTFPGAEVKRLEEIAAKIEKRAGEAPTIEWPAEGDGPLLEIPATADHRPLAPEVVAQIERLGGKLGDALGSETTDLLAGAWPTPMAMRQWRRVAFPRGTQLRGTILKGYGEKTIEIPRGAELRVYGFSQHAPWDCIGYEDTQTFLLVNLLDPKIGNPTVYRIDSEEYGAEPLSTGLTLAKLLGKLKAVGADADAPTEPRKKQAKPNAKPKKPATKKLAKPKKSTTKPAKKPANKRQRPSKR